MPREGQKRLGKEQEVEPGSAGPEPSQAHLAEVGGYPVRQEPGKTAHSLQGGRGAPENQGQVGRVFTQLSPNPARADITCLSGSLWPQPTLRPTHLSQSRRLWGQAHPSHHATTFPLG